MPKRVPFSIGTITAFLPLVFLGAMAAIWGSSPSPLPTHPFFLEQVYRPEVIAHRGGMGEWPENTLFAFRQATQLGVDVLELDVRASREGELVVIHDSSVERTTNGEGRVDELTVQELQQLDAGYSWADDNQDFPYRDQGLRVPTLRQVFEAFPTQRMTIEIKRIPVELAQPLCRMTREASIASQVLVASFQTEFIREFRTACPDVATAATRSEARRLYLLRLLRLDRVFRSSAPLLMVPTRSERLPGFDPGFFSAAARHNMNVYVWTANRQEVMQRWIDSPVQGIVTDYPRRLMRLLGRFKDGKAPTAMAGEWTG